jgi:hypothetical protein
MHQEIEKLINLAFADEQITEKERKVILKKASEFGIDNDEIEMILDGKLHQLEATKQKAREKVGNIKTCPSCGADRQSFSYKCDQCDHEFVNTKEVDAVRNFNFQLSQIPKTSKGAVFFCTDCKTNNVILQSNVTKCYCFKCKKLWIINEDLYVQDYNLKAEIITNLSLPNDKEGLINILMQLLSIQTPKKFDIVDDPETIVRNSARAKLIQSLEIAYLMFVDDQELLKKLKEIELRIQQTSKKENYLKSSIYIFSAIMVFIILFLILLFLYKKIQSNS